MVGERLAGERRQFRTTGAQPVTLMFQPTHYLVVTPERLQQWEQLMVENVGIPRGSLPTPAFASISFCRALDDSDWFTD
jgi:hypothetical protein